jgi:hypothetical protein
VASALTWLLAAAILLGPPLSAVGLVLWARPLRRRGAPRFAVTVAYALVAIVGAVIVTGYVGAVIVVTHAIGREDAEPAPKARAVAEGISAAMNIGALALLFSLAAAGWIGFWSWRRGAK